MKDSGFTLFLSCHSMSIVQAVVVSRFMVFVIVCLYASQACVLFAGPSVDGR